MEDLEEELERKVELLEKERKALRLEAAKHRQEIDQGIRKLQHRLSGLEEGELQEGERERGREGSKLSAYLIAPFDLEVETVTERAA